MLKMIFMVAAILIFKGVLEDCGAVAQISREMLRWRIPLMPISMALPFLVGGVAGITIAFVGGDVSHSDFIDSDIGAVSSHDALHDAGPGQRIRGRGWSRPCTFASCCPMRILKRLCCRCTDRCVCLFWCCWFAAQAILGLLCRFLG